MYFHHNDTGEVLVTDNLCKQKAKLRQYHVDVTHNQMQILYVFLYASEFCVVIPVLKIEMKYLVIRFLL